MVAPSSEVLESSVALSLLTVSEDLSCQPLVLVTWAGSGFPSVAV